jgi:membrane protein DedA with SNARE-associated domain
MPIDLSAQSPLVAVVAALLAGGVGVPIPEELALMAAGYFIAGGRADLRVMAAAAIAAVLAGDLLLYAAGRTGLQLGVARRQGVARRLAAVERAFARHGSKLILVGRFVPGVRSALLIAAGAGRMPLWRLMACDVVAALGGTALWMTLGWHLAPRFERARAVVMTAHSAAVIAVVIATVITIAWMKISRVARQGLRRADRIQSDAAAPGEGDVQSR